MHAFTTLTRAGTTTRTAARLTGIARATMDRTGRSDGPAMVRSGPGPSPVPRNKLSAAEEAGILAVPHSGEFIDQAPAEIYATLLARGEYLCSISTMYRILHRHNEVRDRRRQARNPS